MSKPLAICIEDLADDASPRYLQCVAVSADQPGLGISGHEIRWQTFEVGCQLVVGGDGRLAAIRTIGGPALTLHREGRALEIGEQSPTFLLDQDELAIGERRLRIHIHGPAAMVHPPQPFTGPEPAATTDPDLAINDHSPKVAVVPHPPSVPAWTLDPADRGIPADLNVIDHPPAPLPPPIHPRNPLFFVLLAILTGIGFAVYWFIIR